MIDTRRLCRCATSLTIALLLAAMPVRMDFDGMLLKFTADAAIAKNGSGKGGGNSGGNGNDGKGEAGKGDKGGAGKGGSDKNGGKEKGGASKGGGAPSAKTTSSVSRLAAVRRKGRGDVELVYPEGFREEISNGRYVMRDAQGRTVVARRATDKDRARLNQY